MIQQYHAGLADGAESIRELDLAAMVADMHPPTADDVPIAVDGTRFDTPGNPIAYLEEINAAREASSQLTRSSPSGYPPARASTR